MNLPISSRVLLGTSLALACLAIPTHGAETNRAEVPKCLDTSLTIELLAAEPEIVTPVSCRFDSKGRLFVVESHTHFPPENYEGPKFDRIKIFDDSNGDGKLDRMRVFYEGTVKTMSLAIGRDDSVYVATRAAILKLRDTDRDDVADEVTPLVTLNTTADYPHNGLSGLLLEKPANGPAILTFGMGENFGEKYVLKTNRGEEQIGGGEGGNIFRCQLDGTHLERVATGFWNPFGLCRDDAGRLLMVDNDADAMPPCRIVHVVPKADYGFQFRFGRAGTHPLQAWNGELPGTLPMVAGTGEAPCAILCHRGQYWVTSWGDNRIERYTPQPSGAASVQSSMEVAVQGGAMFRPVDMAIAPDGSMLVTDWVDRSYNVHRKGRIWRIRFNTPYDPNQASPSLTKLAPAESDLHGYIAAHQDQVRDVLAGKTSDPFLLHALTSDANYRKLLVESGLLPNDSPRIRQAALQEARWNRIASASEVVNADGVRSMIRKSLTDPDESIRKVAIRWAAETADPSLLPDVAKQLEADSVSPSLLAMVAASISYLQTGKVEKGGFDALTRQTLVQLAVDETKSPRLRRMALLLVPPNSPQWKPDMLLALARNSNAELARSAGRHLVMAAIESNQRGVLAPLLKDSNLNAKIRADLAIASPASASSTDSTAKPDPQNIDEWIKLVGEGGDAENGWRVFFDGQQGKCASCHMRDGRGASVGPDLTSIRSMVADRRRLLESLLHPSREIGPMYTTWKVLTTDDRTIVGLKLNGGGVGESSRYLLPDATTIDIPMQDIADQVASEKSIMPEGLLEPLSVDAVRDLLAFLTSAPELQ